MTQDDARPRYLRIADKLRARILSGELKEGDRLPSIPEMARENGVATSTAQAVIRVLVSEGLAAAKSGSGTYVRARSEPRRLVRSWHRNATGGSPFASDMVAQGRSGTWDYDSRSTQSDTAVRARLALDEPADDRPDVLQTDYVFRGDGQPVMLSTSWEPLKLTRGTPVVIPEEGPRAGTGVVERMRSIGVQITHAGEVVSARQARESEAAVLGVAQGSIVLTIERTYYADTEPVETADIVIPVDRYQVVYGTSVWDVPAGE